MTDATEPQEPLPSPPPPGDIAPVTIEEEMRRSYLDYAMSVIVSRALPDVRDGLKPVHRRILYGMNELGLDWNKKYVKSAKVVGEVMGNFHPHGDSAIYDALARMVQPWSMRVPLIDGQGNFGSMDPDPPAAMRYTESRLAKVANALLDDLDKDTVDFVPNYDSARQEPSVLPAKFPNLLVNGSAGIAVGMATNIPPHNLTETINASVALIDKPELSVDDLMEHLPAPDFPTHGIVYGLEGVMAKRLGSPYQPGKRTPNWRKVKNRVPLEVVIGGFNPGTGNRSNTFGALLVGLPQPDGRLRFAGGVGTGFTHARLEALTKQLRALATKDCPFDPPPPRAEVRHATWVRPELRARIEIAEITNDEDVTVEDVVELIASGGQES